MLDTILRPDRWLATSQDYLLDMLRRCDRSKGARFITVAVLLTPLIVFTKWFAVVHGGFTYDDFDILAMLRTTPLAQSLFLFHGDVPIPLFRLFCAAMYALFGVDEFYWNLYFLLLIVAVNGTALAILVALGANLIVSALFYLTAISAAVWSYTAAGYYSLSIYPQIGLLGLIGVLAIVLWRNGGSPNYKWLAFAAGALAPFIHPSGAYVPVAIGGFAYVSGFADPKAKPSLFAMFGRDLRWLTLGLAASLAIFALFFAAASHSRGGQFLTMAHSPLSATAVLKSLYLLLSQGMSLALLKPLIPRLLSRVDPALLGAVALALMCGLIAAGLRKIPREQRWTFLALLMPALVNIVVVSFGRRLNSIEDVVNTAGKYNNSSYLWFTVSAFYLLACVAPRIPWRWRGIAATASILLATAIFISYARQTNGPALEAALRRQQMNDLLVTFSDYAARTAPVPLHIPTLDGAYIFVGHPLLFVYNLAHYRPFFTFDSRLTLLRNAAMDTWGIEGTTQTVPSLRSAIDPAFLEALKSNAKLQSFYFGGAELAPMAKRIVAGDTLHLDAVKMTNAEVLYQDDRTLSFTTSGGASLILSDAYWDPELMHILSMRVEAYPNNQKGDGKVPIEVSFDGQLPIPYAPVKLSLSNDKPELSVDLLQVYAYALNQRVGRLALSFPRAGRYTISDVRLGK